MYIKKKKKSKIEKKIYTCIYRKKKLKKKKKKKDKKIYICIEKKNIYIYKK